MRPFVEALPELPVLGVGASLSFGADPDPVQFASLKGGPSFIEYAGAVQHQYLEPALSKLRQAEVPLLYHPSCLNLCGPYPNPRSWVAAVDAHVQAVSSPWLAQDVAICFVGDDPGYSIQLGYFVPPILTEASLAEATERVLEVRSSVQAPLLLEPAPVTFLVGDMTIFEWLTQLAHRTECGLLLDAGHVVSHQLARGVADLLDGLDALDFSRVVEVHVAGGIIFGSAPEPRYYQDAHDLPILPETWRVFQAILERASALRAVCVECEGSLARAVLPVLARTRERVAEWSANPSLCEKVQQELAR
jgi:uncharacterized protein (UPF0276 family)